MTRFLGRGARVVIAILTVALLGGCAGSAGYASHRFESEDELKSVLALAGVDCSQFPTDDKAATQASLVKYGFDSLPCDDAAATIWRTETDRVSIQSKSWNALKPGYSQIEGSNWTLMVATRRVAEVNKTLKGNVA